MKVSELKAKHEAEMAELQESYNHLQDELESTKEVMDRQKKSFDDSLQALDAQRQEAKAQAYKYRTDCEAAKDECAKLEVRLGAEDNKLTNANARIEELEMELRNLKASIRAAEEYP